MVNPYQHDPNEDDDLFGKSDDEETASKSYSSDPFESVLRELEKSGPQGQHIAKAMRSMHGKAELPKMTELVNQFMAWQHRNDNLSQNSSVLRAVVEVLDEQTDGKVRVLWNFYELERKVVAAYHSMRAIRTVTTEFREEQAAKNMEPDTEVESCIALLSSFSTEKYNEVYGRYCSLAHDLDKEPIDMDSEDKDIDQVGYPEWMLRLLFNEFKTKGPREEIN